MNFAGAPNGAARFLARGTWSSPPEKSSPPRLDAPPPPPPETLRQRPWPAPSRSAAPCAAPGRRPGQIQPREAILPSALITERPVSWMSGATARFWGGSVRERPYGRRLYSPALTLIRSARFGRDAGCPSTTDVRGPTNGPAATGPFPASIALCAKLWPKLPGAPPRGRELLALPSRGGAGRASKSARRPSVADAQKKPLRSHV